MANSISASKSVFAELGLSETLQLMKSEIQELYLLDTIPWVIGYSGGKDSTAVVSLVWMSIAELDPAQRHKPIHVITTDTMVENPIVSAWVKNSLARMEQKANEKSIPIQPRLLLPEIPDTFWVNLIGRGYPAPRNKFRWCTERLKIKPTNAFIQQVVRANGEAIVVLGTRSAESSKRASTIKRHAKDSIKERLIVNPTMYNSLIYKPIEDWSNDDVWLFLMRLPNPWGQSNKELMGMYRGASADGECPLVVDTSTPSCGNSRFGCWVCTLVDQDKSMAAMIQNDQEKDWMLPLLELRNELDFRSEEARARERSRRDFRRIWGKPTHYMSQGEVQLVPGPYKPEAREYWLRRVLETQKYLEENAPKEMGAIELITKEELQEIRRIWVVDKHEIEDRVPVIYQEVMGKPYPGQSIDDHQVFDNEALALLKESCEDDDSGLQYELLRNLIDVERRFRTMTRRRGLFEAIETEIERCFYDDAEDALEFVRAHQVQLKGVDDYLDDLALRVHGHGGQLGQPIGALAEHEQEDLFAEEAEEADAE